MSGNVKRADIDTLLMVVGDGDVQHVSALLEGEVEVNERGKKGEYQGFTPLGLAFNRGFPSITRLLLEHGARVDALELVDIFLAHFAKKPMNITLEIWLECARMLVSGSDKSARYPDDPHVRTLQLCQLAQTPLPEEYRDRLESSIRSCRATLLEDAICEGDLAYVREELRDVKTMQEVRAIVPEDDNFIYGSAHLLWAAGSGNLDMVRFFLDLGADICVCDNEVGTALSLAISYRYNDIAFFLIDAYQRNLYPSAGAAGLVGDHNSDVRWTYIVPNLLEGHSEPTGQQETFTPLTLALDADNPGLIARLLEAGASPDGSDELVKGGYNYRRPIYHAQSADALRLLLAAGARFRAEDAWDEEEEREERDGQWDAEENRRRFLAAIECRASAERECAERWRETLLKKDQPVDAGLFNQLITDYDQEKLTWQECQDCLQLLLQAGSVLADETLLACARYDIASPLQFFAQRGLLDLRSFAPIGGINLLHHAASCGCKEVAEFLLNAGCPVNSQTGAMDLVGRYRAERMWTQPPRSLVPMGFEMPIKFAPGMSALHLAVQQNHPAIVTLLLTRGADVNLRSAEGQRPLDLAHSRYIRDLLRAAGAQRGLEEFA